MSELFFSVSVLAHFVIYFVNYKKQKNQYIKQRSDLGSDLI